jgi:hypothetical protein
MDAKELRRIAIEEDERRRQFGLDARTLEQIARQHETIAKAAGLYDYPIRSIAEKIAQMELNSITRAKDILLQSPIFDLAQEANRSIVKMFEDVAGKSMIDQLKVVAGVQASEWLNFREQYAPQIPVDRFLSSQLGQITQTSLLAQNVLAGIEIRQIGNAFHLADEIKASFSNNFIDFSSSYKDLFQSFEIPEIGLLMLPPSIAKFPTNEFFNGVDLIETTVDEESEDEYVEERIVVRNDLRLSTNDSVIYRLREVNPDWINMLEGAKQAFNSTNPDKTRHCITSLRELVREIMHYLSPDNEIRGWSESPQDFSNNRPTRKARLRFISRNINHGAFTEFVEKDIEAMIAAINIFQAGTHVANSRLTEPQISALITRVEGIILFLFSMAEYKEQ